MAWFVSRWRPLTSTCSWTLLMAGAVALLSAFTLVVCRAADQADQRRRESALLWQATWHCNALRRRQERRLCLAQLHQAAPEVTTQRAVDGPLAATAGPPTVP
jgi:hypothetical protein